MSNEYLLFILLAIYSEMDLHVKLMWKNILFIKVLTEMNAEKVKSKWIWSRQTSFTEDALFWNQNEKDRDRQYPKQISQ